MKGFILFAFVIFFTDLHSMKSIKSIPQIWNLLKMFKVRMSEFEFELHHI